MAKFVNIHTHSYSSNEVIEVVNRYPYEIDGEEQFHFSSGLHPWRLSNGEEEIALLKQHISQPNLIAIGECGLDFINSDVSREQQEELFEQQLLLAQEHNKPVIVHCVKAYDRVLSIHAKLKITVPVVMHSFKGNDQILEQFVKRGMYVSFGKWLFVENSVAVECVKKLSLQQFFLETDVQEDLSIEAVYQKVAELRGEGIQETKEKIHQNYRSVFHARL